MPDYPLGHTEPAVWTRPLVELTPDTSYGFAVVEFARDILDEPLDPWEEWAAIHAGELLADGRPRFRYLLVIVARQNGKTHLLKVLSLFWLFVERWRLILGTSSNLDYAKESWEAAVQHAEDNEELGPKIAPRGGVRRTNGEQTLTTTDRCRYKIAAANRKGGRSLAIDRLILDELREHHDYAAWNASTKATNARPYAQVISITNMGDDESVVLNDQLEAAVEFTQTGVGDPRKGVFAWMAPAGAATDDPEAIAMANPNAGRRIDWDTLMGDAITAKQKGGEQEAGFRTEVMCIRVRSLDPAIAPEAWDASATAGNLSGSRGRVALCLDISPDELHATLVAAATTEHGTVWVEPVKAWAGADATAQVRAELPGLVAKVRPQELGWLPGGPAAALAADLTAAKLGTTVREIKTDAPAACMGLANLVKTNEVEHPGDPLLDSHVKGAERLYTGERWVFSRKGGGHCDAAYAVAGAVHLARTLKPSSGVDKIITVTW